MELQPASLLSRLGAFLFDHFLVSFISIAIAAGLGHGQLPEPGERAGMIAIASSFLLFFCRDAVNGISPGRWVAGIMVRSYVDPRGLPSFPQRFLRNLMLVLWPVEAISIFFSTEFRRLGDKAANSIVLLNTERARVGFRIIPIILLIGAFIGFSYLYATYALKNSEPYNVSIKYIESSTEARELTGGVKGYGTIPAGHISVANGTGEATFMIQVMGEKKNITADVYLEMKNARWEVTRCEFR
jgi:hypothetical protein